MLPENVKHIIDDLRSQEWVDWLLGFKNVEMFLVGGCVRDAFRHQPIKDVDIVVDGLHFRGENDINYLHDQLVDFGKINLVGESFKVIKFRPKGHTGEDYDIAIPRKDTKVGSGHKGFKAETKGVSILEDLKRRDFTVNSIAINVETGEMLDPFNGKADIIQKIIRATDPTAFIEDPLRILRGIQFAARFGYKIEPGTKKLMQKYAHELKTISGERIFDEFQKILLKKGDTQIALNLIHETDVDLALFDKKMLKYDKGFEKLDPVSFYYVLSLVGDVDPVKFYLKNLKGLADVGKALGILDTLLESWASLHEEEDRRFVLFKSLQKSPMLANVVIFPPDASDIIEEMKSGKTPMTSKDINITGNEIMEITKLPQSEELGELIERIQRDALMNKFNWKDKKSCVNYVSKIFYK